MMQKYDLPYVGCLVGVAFQRMLKDLEKELEKQQLPISGPEYMILRALFAKNGASQSDVVEMVGKDKSSICRSIKSLASRGLVRVEQVSYKLNRIWLSEEAEKMKPKIMEVAATRHEDLASRLSDNGLKLFVEMLNKIIE